MARKDMTALVQLPADAHTLLNPTYTALSGFTGMQWQNTGREMVWIINGASACNYTINIGAKIVGQTVTPFGPTALPTNNTAGRSLGPFSAVHLTHPDLTTVIADPTPIPPPIPVPPPSDALVKQIEEQQRYIRELESRLGVASVDYARDLDGLANGVLNVAEALRALHPQPA